MDEKRERERERERKRKRKRENGDVMKIRDRALGSSLEILGMARPWQPCK